MSKRFFLNKNLMLIFFGLLFLVACNQQVETVLFDEKNSDIEVIPTGEVKEFIITAFQFGYNPSILEVDKGDLVRIIASSRDVSHGLAIPLFGVNLYLGSDGSEQTVEFLADKEGTFTFYCSVSCGSGHGRMSGQLIVR
ncbi:cytochrome C oxidase subunit II [Candidatus Woesearchaeota archaeon]|jgi:cytochrome c oxidase subunit 2|nr:cytochrome C oxidase subunit II [Candidatus Woesearchaeota archaeon]|tara:strand:+ start:142 stop:558 length:417 start_codon:yes stop_codon:yes gene_type:complete